MTVQKIITTRTKTHRASEEGIAIQFFRSLSLTAQKALDALMKEGGDDWQFLLRTIVLKSRALRSRDMKQWGKIIAEEKRYLTSH